MMNISEKFEIIDERTLSDMNGGGIGGICAGWILGGTVGLIGATAAGIANGELTLEIIGKAYTTGALVGMAIGTATPV